MAHPKTTRNEEIYGLYKQMREIPDKDERLIFLYDRILKPYRISERRMYYIVKWVEGRAHSEAKFTT